MVSLFLHLAPFLQYDPFIGSSIVRSFVGSRDFGQFSRYLRIDLN